ncbi:MAG: cell division protein FtsQ/DivIB [Desulfovibrionaceae bacterium]
MIGASIGTKNGAAKRRPARSNRRKGGGGGFSGPASPALRRSGLAFGFLVCLALLMVGLFGGYRWAVTTDQFAIGEIEVTGNRHLSYGDVLAAGGLRLGENCLGLNVTRVQARLAKNPWVASVLVRRELPGKITVEVEERGAAYWAVNGDRLYYADEHGGLITAVTPGDFVSLPVLEAPGGLRGELAGLPRLLEALGRSSLGFEPERLASLRVLPGGDVECFLDGNGLTLRLSLRDFSTQLALMERVAEDLRLRGELDDAAGITAGPDRVWVHKRT